MPLKQRSALCFVSIGNQTLLILLNNYIVYICVAVNSAGLNIELIYCNLKLQDPTEKHFGDVGILDKYEDNNNNSKSVYP